MKPLTDRELTCLRWAALGKTSWEMGVILGLTERTINFHIHSACQKLGVHGRQAAITSAFRLGLLAMLSEPPGAHQETHRPLAAGMTPDQP
ncbi:MAG TPA: helix-turn-helix domain-containing protein [Candidimonas sp.]|nr:helix-turn-helix domain-containing protein [Candidimonas sp.]